MTVPAPEPEPQLGPEPVAGGRSPGGDPPWAVVQHVAHEGPGLIASALAAAGYRYRIVRCDQGEPLPDPSSIAGLVVMGGPMGVHDDEAHPWLVPERQLLAGAVARGLPVLGVCLGAQQLAAALGAAVTTGPDAEIGPGSVALLPGARQDPVFGALAGEGAASIPCVHWHQDTFAIPAGAVHLAATDLFPNQAFRAGPRAYGLQFHVEVDRALAAAWAGHLPPGTAFEPEHLARVEAVGTRLLGQFVGLAAPSLADPVPAGQRELS